MKTTRPQSDPLSRCDASGGQRAAAVLYTVAFALIELLAVIASIAILAAILLPALARVNERGKRIQRSSNQEQVGAGALMSAADCRDFVLEARNQLVQTCLGPPGASLAKMVGSMVQSNSASIWACPDAPMKIDGKWGGDPEPDRGAIYRILPQHCKGNSKVPAGGNQLFADGSARWCQFEAMCFFYSWDSGGTKRATFFRQDTGDFDQNSLNRLSSLESDSLATIPKQGSAQTIGFRPFGMFRCDHAARI